MSSTIPDLYESIFVPSFEYTTVSGFKARLDTKLNGNVEIGNSNTLYSLYVNGVEYGGNGSPIAASNWSLYPTLNTIRTVSAGNITLSATTFNVIGNLNTTGSVTGSNGIFAGSNSVVSNLSATGNFQTNGNARIFGNLTISGTLTAGSLGPAGNVITTSTSGLSNIFSIRAQNSVGSNYFSTNFTSYTSGNRYGYLQINASSDLTGQIYNGPVLSISYGTPSSVQTTNIYGTVTILDFAKKNAGLNFTTNSNTSEIKWSMSGESNSNFNYKLYESNDGTLYLTSDKSDGIFSNIASFRTPYTPGSSGYYSISGAGYTTKFANRTEFSRDIVAAYQSFAVTATGDTDLPYTSVHMRTSSSNKYTMVALPSKKFTFGYYPSNSTDIIGTGVAGEQQIYEADPVSNTFTLNSKLVMSNDIDLQGNVISNANVVGSIFLTDAISNYNTSLPSPNVLFKFPTAPGVYQAYSYSTDANNLVISSKFTVANNGTTYRILFEPSLSTFTEVYPYIYNTAYYAIKNMKTFSFFGIKTTYTKMA